MLLLDDPFKKKDFSDAFLARSATMGFRTLGDILAVTPVMLVNKKEFCYLWLEELTSVLKRHNQLHLLQAMPGSNVP